MITGVCFTVLAFLFYFGIIAPVDITVFAFAGTAFFAVIALVVAVICAVRVALNRWRNANVARGAELRRCATEALALFLACRAASLITGAVVVQMGVLPL